MAKINLKDSEMANTTDFKQFNPLLWWTAEEIADLEAEPGRRKRGLPPAGLAGIASMQRLGWELMTQNWTRWLANLGNVMAAGAGVGLSRKRASHDNPLEVVRENLRPDAWSELAAGSGARGKRAQPAERRSVRSGPAHAQHAMAASEPKPRRKAAAKSKRTSKK